MNILPPLRTSVLRPQMGPDEIYKFQPTIDAIATPPPIGAGSDPLLPFKIMDVSPDASTPTINVRFGTVMDISPTEIATDIILTDDATNTIYLDCTLNSAGLVTDVDLLVGTSGLPASTSTNAILLVGYCVVADGAITTINQSIIYSQGFVACGRDAEDPSTTPGTYHFSVR